MLFKSSLQGITKTIKENKSLSLILLVGFLVRIWGVWYGLPLFFVGDEHHLPGAALKMGAEKSLIANYSTLYEPPFLAYLYLVLYGFTFPFLMLFKGIFSFSELQGYLVLNPTFPWLVARLSTVVMGTVLIYLIYRITSFWGNRQAAYLAALFVAFDPMMVQMSHFARIWVPGTFLAYFSLYFSILAFKSGKNRDYILSAVFAGFSAATTWITGVIIIALFLAFVLSGNPKHHWRGFLLAALIFILIIAITVLVNPYNFFRYVGMYLYGQENIDKISNFRAMNFAGEFHGRVFLGELKKWLGIISEYNLPILIAAMGGLGLLFLKDWRLFILIFCFPIFIFIFYAACGGFSRYMIPVMPALALAASWFIVWGQSKISKKIVVSPRYWLGIGILLVGAYSFAIVILWDYRISFTDTRALATEWIGKNIAAQSRIIMSERNSVNYFYLWENPEAISFVRVNAPERIGVERKYLSRLTEKLYPQPAYFTIHLNEPGIGNKLQTDLIDFIRDRNFDYLAVAFWEEGSWVGSQYFEKVPKELIQRFSPGEKIVSDMADNMRRPLATLWNQKRPGPMVEIYRINWKDGREYGK